MALSRSITIDGKTNKPTIFAVQAQASYAKSLIFVAEARVAVRTNKLHLGRYRKLSGQGLVEAEALRRKLPFSTTTRAVTR